MGPASMGVTNSLPVPVAYKRTAHSQKFCETEHLFQLVNFRLRRRGSLLPGLRTLDPPLSPPSTLVEIVRRKFLEGGGIFF